MTTSLPTAPEGGNLPSATWLVRKGVRLAAAFAILAVVAVIVTVSACSGIAPHAGQSSAADLETQAQVADKVLVCSFCHGPGGRSVWPAFPRLAGQQRDYLSAQLKAFRDKTRTDPPGASINMAGMAAYLSDAMIAQLAAYYSAESMTPSSAQDLAGVAAGKNIYEQGIRDKIPPCLTCHGARAEGSGTTPRLAGQRRSSLEHQLASFAADTRPNALMHKETMNLTAPQISDVAAYLAAQ